MERISLPCISPGYLRNCSWKRSRWPCSVSAGRPVAMGTARMDPGCKLSPKFIPMHPHPSRLKPGPGWEQGIPMYCSGDSQECSLNMSLTA